MQVFSTEPFLRGKYGLGGPCFSSFYFKIKLKKSEKVSGPSNLFWLIVHWINFKHAQLTFLLINQLLLGKTFLGILSIYSLRLEVLSNKPFHSLSVKFLRILSCHIQLEKNMSACVSFNKNNNNDIKIYIYIYFKKRRGWLEVGTTLNPYFFSLFSFFFIYIFVTLFLFFIFLVIKRDTCCLLIGYKMTTLLEIDNVMIYLITALILWNKLIKFKP